MSERVYCLYRVSIPKQLSYTELKQPDIPMQKNACREFADRMGWDIIREEQENGISGFKVSAAKRDKIQLIKEHAEQGLFDILLVFMFDRIGRRAEETPFVVEWFVEHGIRVWSVTEGEQRFDSHTDYLLNYIRYWQASGESKKTSIRTKTALAQMVQEGRFRGGKTPYGYTLVKTDRLNKHKRPVHELVINASEADIVRLIFNLCANYGYGRCRIAKELHKRNIRNRQNSFWSEATIGAMLHNVLYTGILRSGETYSQSFDSLRIIDQSTFDTVQKLMLERNHTQQAHRTFPLNTTGQSLLSGNVFCGHCGGRLILTTNGKTIRRADGSLVRSKRIRYVCYNKTRHRCNCSGQTGYTMHRIDAVVADHLLQALGSIANYNGWEEICANADHELTQLQIKRNALSAEYRQALQRYAEMKSHSDQSPYTTSSSESHLTDDLMLIIIDEVTQAKSRYDSISNLIQTKTQQLNELVSAHREFTIWYRIFDICEKERQKMILAKAIARVDVCRDYRIKITYQDEFQRLQDLCNPKATL